MFAFVNFDVRIRSLMVEELDLETGSINLYISPRLLADCTDRYVAALREAMVSHDEIWLADQIRGGMLCSYEWRELKRRTIEVEVPENAHETLAEGEFNRFYMRAICRAAIADGQERVQVYRAKESEYPRSASERMLGKLINAAALLDDLRRNQGTDTALGLPPGPNSGLSVRQLVVPSNSPPIGVAFPLPQPMP